ncbi:hypothetical protein QTQ03_24875 [Micromonospora sp. WMMA1363]|uniref:hypothetical protein n=1 Tax=Micromonospora sp. WMMA1363 TaxID=3053985 RepID=UPI00259C9EB1|nr:hypothetical protein [Micromonospora sp. WMMA1363]MDM4722671.1 hypothetical protein [Micromonospora sp. WMMA1363]
MRIGIALVFPVLGGLGPLRTLRRPPRGDRLTLVPAAVWTLLYPALAHRLGDWSTVPGWLWPLGMVRASRIELSGGGRRTYDRGCGAARLPLRYRSCGRPTVRVGEQSTDPIDQVLGEVPVPVPLTPEDVRLAVRAVVVHTAEEWPSGPLCRNDGATYPCRLHRWGRRVLLTHGLNERQIDALVRHGNPFVHVPFPFTVNGPAPARHAAPVAARSAGTAPPRTAAAAPARPGYPVRGQAAARVVGPGARPGVRPAGPGRSTPATAPRWPRAS